LNAELAESVRWEVDARSVDCPHTKTNLLLQAYFSDLPLPISDYYTDTKMVLDQAIRLLQVSACCRRTVLAHASLLVRQAMVDIAADAGFLKTSLRLMNLAQMIVQGRYPSESTLLTLPHVTNSHVEALARQVRVVCCDTWCLGNKHVC